MSGNNNNNKNQGGGGRGRGGRRRRRNDNNNNRGEHSPNRRRRHDNNNNNNTEHASNGGENTGHNHHQRRQQSPHHGRNIHQNHQRHHQNHQHRHPQHQQPHHGHKKTIISEPEPLVPNANLAKLLNDPIPPLIISFDVENASGTWMGEIWQIGAVSSASSTANTCPDDSSMQVDHQQSSSSFLINILPVGTIHWGVTKHCTNVRVNHDQRTGRRCLWHTIRKQELLPAPVDPPTGLSSFLDWIEREQKSYYNAFMALKDMKKPSAPVEAGKSSPCLPAVILMAHGNLDCPNLLNNLAEYNLLSRFESLVAGFVDSQRYLNNGLTAISDRLFPNETFDAHNALADSLVLYRALHIKQPPSQSGMLPPDRLALVEPLQETYIATPDAIAITRYKVSKLVQKLAQQNNNQNDTVRNIMALLSVDNVAQLLKNVVFQDLERKEGGSRPPEVFLVKSTNSGRNGMSDADGSYGSNNTTIIAFDVQFTESTGVRSNIHRICALELGYQNGSNKDDDQDSSTSSFDMTCVPPDELHLLATSSDEKSHTTKDVLEQFVNWLTTTSSKHNHDHVVLCAYGSRKRKWPGLLNHMSYHGLEAKCASVVVGVCDLALAMASTAVASSNNGNAAKNLDAKSQDKAHKAFCPNDKSGPPIPHRANEVCQSNYTIANEVIHRRSSLSSPSDSNADLLLPLLETAITYRSAYVNAQFLLDQSLGADIMAGVQFDGNGQAYKGYRLPRLQ